MRSTDQSGTEPSRRPLPTPRPGHRRSIWPTPWLAGLLCVACGGGPSFDTVDGYVGIAGARSGSVFPGASGAAGAPGGTFLPSGAPGERTPQPITFAEQVRGYLGSTGGAPSSTGGTPSSTGGTPSSEGSELATLSACIEDQGANLLLRLGLLASSSLSGSVELRYPGLDEDMAAVDVLYSNLCSPNVDLSDGIVLACDASLSAGSSWDVQLSIHRDDYSPIDVADGCGGAAAYVDGVQIAVAP